MIPFKIPLKYHAGRRDAGETCRGCCPTITEPCGEPALSRRVKLAKGTYSSSDSLSTSTKSESHLGFKCDRLRLWTGGLPILLSGGLTGGTILVFW